MQLDLLAQAANLRFVRQQPPRAARVFVEDVALLIGADVDPFCYQLAVIDIRPGILEVYPTGAQAFDLGADQLNAGFQRFDHKVFVAHLTVDGNHFLSAFVLGHGHTSFAVIGYLL